MFAFIYFTRKIELKEKKIVSVRFSNILMTGSGE
jgi:hypothetical protein